MKKNAGLWSRGLNRSRQGIWGKISKVLGGKSRLDDAALESLEEILIEADVGVETSGEIIEEMKGSSASQEGTLEESAKSLLKQKLFISLQASEERKTKGSFSGPLQADQPLPEKPLVILVVGVNGTGKTTTIGKLAYWYKNAGKKVLLAGADTFRAAAGEQLEIWGKRSGADVVRQSMGSDPAALAFDATDAALARGVDVLIVDTAGRLHTKVNLMEELKKIRRVLKKRLDSAPHEVLLVLDATTGQNGLVQARQFAEAVEVTGIALTKLDGTARGGIVLAIHRKLDLPVEWVGLGEGIEDLVPFDAEAFIDGLFG